MKGDLKLTKISKNSITDIGDKYCVDNRNEVYFLAYETEPEKRISVLWSDLKWLRKFYGVERFNENCVITKESLNSGRKQTIADLKTCIKLKIHQRALEYLQEDGSFGMVINHNIGKPNPVSGLLDWRKEIPRTPEVLTKNVREIYEKDIARGLYIICEYV